VKEIRGAINEYDKTHNNEKEDVTKNLSCNKPCCNKKEADQNNKVKYVDINGNFVNEKGNKQNCDNKECNDTKVKGSYFDSNKMEKPEQFEFTGSFDKLIPNFINFLNKIL
ncbi:MAG: hypothetical protein II670_11805, partial [Alphaproteobacteria bacterium]|nr:hypothetical protein [Alphaproteobacteria bacterium]